MQKILKMFVMLSLIVCLAGCSRPELLSTAPRQLSLYEKQKAPDHRPDWNKIGACRKAIADFDANEKMYQEERLVHFKTSMVILKESGEAAMRQHDELTKSDRDGDKRLFEVERDITEQGIYDACGKLQENN